MRSIQITDPGPLSQLKQVEQEIPNCGDEQLLIRVRATALNRADIMQRQGKYPPPAGESTTPGLELAGEVVALGTGVKNFKIGDRVYGLVAGGAYADYCCLEQGLAAKMPELWDFNYAAAIPEALMTAHATVCLIGQLQEKQHLLIHAAGSGISCFAIQMANLLGAMATSTTSSPQKIAKAKTLGLKRLINYKEEDFEAILTNQTIDLIIDFIGGEYFPKHLRLLKTQGKLIQIASLQGHLVECNLALIMRKRLQINGFVLRSQSLTEKKALWQSAQKQWAAALKAGQLKPLIDSVFRFEDLEKAHEKMITNAHFGKIVVSLS